MIVNWAAVVNGCKGQRQASTFKDNTSFSEVIEELQFEIIEELNNNGQFLEEVQIIIYE